MKMPAQIRSYPLQQRSSGAAAWPRCEDASMILREITHGKIVQIESKRKACGTALCAAQVRRSNGLVLLSKQRVANLHHASGFVTPDPFELERLPSRFALSTRSAGFLIVRSSMPGTQAVTASRCRCVRRRAFRDRVPVPGDRPASAGPRHRMPRNLFGNIGRK